MGGKGNGLWMEFYCSHHSIQFYCEYSVGSAAAAKINIQARLVEAVNLEGKSRRNCSFLHNMPCFTSFYCCRCAYVSKYIPYSHSLLSCDSVSVLYDGNKIYTFFCVCCSRHAGCVRNILRNTRPPSFWECLRATILFPFLLPLFFSFLCVASV